MVWCFLMYMTNFLFQWVKYQILPQSWIFISVIIEFVIWASYTSEEHLDSWVLMWSSLGYLWFHMCFGVTLYNKVIRDQRNCLNCNCHVGKNAFPFSPLLGNSQKHFIAIFQQESVWSCSYWLFLSQHIKMCSWRKTKCSNCSIFFHIGSRSRDKLLIIVYYEFEKPAMNWDLVTASF